ncbi:MAG TPA: hypothetical protein VKB67_03340 [Rhizomicrobium sp.]|nr:hypothetical protein [Rhizomicrobium sp.]
MAVGAVVAVGDFLLNAVAKSSVFPRRLQLIAGSFRIVPRRYASMDDRLDILVKPYLARLVEQRNQFLFRDEFGEVQHDQWARELGRFIDETVMPRLGPHKAFAQRRLLYLAGCLDDLIAKAGSEAA